MSHTVKVHRRGLGRGGGVDGICDPVAQKEVGREGPPWRLEESRW